MTAKGRINQQSKQKEKERRERLVPIFLLELDEKFQFHNYT